MTAAPDPFLTCCSPCLQAAPDQIEFPVHRPPPSLGGSPPSTRALFGAARPSAAAAPVPGIHVPSMTPQHAAPPPPPVPFAGFTPSPAPRTGVPPSPVRWLADARTPLPAPRGLGRTQSGSLAGSSPWHGAKQQQQQGAPTPMRSPLQPARTPAGAERSSIGGRMAPFRVLCCACCADHAVTSCRPAEEAVRAAESKYGVSLLPLLDARSLASLEGLSPLAVGLRLGPLLRGQQQQQPSFPCPLGVMPVPAATCHVAGGRRPGQRRTERPAGPCQVRPRKPWSPNGSQPVLTAAAAAG